MFRKSAIFFAVVKLTNLLRRVLVASGPTGILDFEVKLSQTCQ